MNNLSMPFNCVPAILLLTAVCFGHAMADDAVPPKSQSDDAINLWVNNAPLELFVAQLASVTGREASIDGDLVGVVSGTFDGSIADTLSSIEAQHGVLFDLQDSTLSAVPDVARTQLAFALNGPMDDELRQNILADGLAGNVVDIGETEVMISGHPSFVERMGAKLTQGLLIADDQTANEPQVVVDAAASVMVSEELAPETRSETASTDGSAKPILSVTDIPGFHTF